MRFALFNEDGSIRRDESQQPKRTSDDPLEYTYWLKYEADYYVQEKPVSGYRTVYVNTKKSGHEDVTDRCYNGGTIINIKIPQTGDRETPWLWLMLGCMALLLVPALNLLKKRQ